MIIIDTIPKIIIFDATKDYTKISNEAYFPNDTSRSSQGL